MCKIKDQTSKAKININSQLALLALLALLAWVALLAGFAGFGSAGSAGSAGFAGFAGFAGLAGSLAGFFAGWLFCGFVKWLIVQCESLCLDFRYF